MKMFGRTVGNPPTDIRANSLKVAVDLYRRVTEPDTELETARAEVIANVANYVKTHPRARPHEIQQYVEGQIAVFKTKIK